MWLQHAGCCSLATGAEVEAVPLGGIFMTRGWGDVACACRPEGALAIHYEYEGASTLFFKVFDEEGRRLECCSRGSSPRGAAAGVEPASGIADNRSSSSGDSWESSDSPETSDDSYVPPSSRRTRSVAATSTQRHR